MCVLCCVVRWFGRLLCVCCVGAVWGGATLFPVSCSPPSGVEGGAGDITIIRVWTSMDV